MFDPIARPRKNTNAARFVADTRGAVSTEYVVLVGTVSLAMIFALVTVGPSLVRSFEHTRNVLISPFP